jgi:hypothetical protein
MTKSFILIEVDEDLKEATKEAIRKHPAVSGVYTVIDGGDEDSAIYDMVVMVEADTGEILMMQSLRYELVKN